MTKNGDWELRIDLGDWSSPLETAYAYYDSVTIGDESEKYALSIGTYNGTAGKYYKIDHSDIVLIIGDLNGKFW